MADLVIQYKVNGELKKTEEVSVEVDGKVDEKAEAQSVQEQLDQFKKDNPEAKIVRIFVDSKSVSTNSIKRLLAATEDNKDESADAKATKGSKTESKDKADEKKKGWTHFFEGPNKGKWKSPDGKIYSEDQLEMRKLPGGSKYVIGFKGAKPKKKAKAKKPKAQEEQPKAAAQDGKKADASAKADLSDTKKDFKGTQEASISWTDKGHGYSRRKKGYVRLSDGKYYKSSDLLDTKDGKKKLKKGAKPVDKSEAVASGRTSDKKNEETVKYTSDGVAGLTEAEAQSILDGIEAHDIVVDSEKPGDVTIQVPDKAEPLTLADLKDFAGGRIKDDEIPAGAAEDPTDDILKPDPLQMLADDPSSFEAIEKMKLQKRKLDTLIALLISLLQSGRGDVDLLIGAVLQAIAQKNNMTLGELGAKLAKQLGAKSEEAEEIGEQLEKAYNNKNPGKAAAAVSKLRLKLQNNQQSMSQIKSMLEQAMSQRNQNDELASGYIRNSNRHAERMSIFS